MSQRHSDTWQRHLLRYAGAYRWSLAFGCAVAVAQAIVVVALPWPMKLAVDNVLGNQPVPDWADWLEKIPAWDSTVGALVVLGVGSVLLVAANGALLVTRQVWRRTLGLRMSSHLAHDTLSRVQGRSPAAATQYRSGDLVQRVVTDTKCIDTLVFGVWMTAFQSFVTFLLLAVVLVSVSPEIFLIVLGVALPMLAISRAYRSRMRRDALLLADAQADVTTATQQMLSTLPEIQSFGAEPAELSRFTRDADAQVAATLRSQRTSLGFGTAVGSVTSAGTGLVMIVGGFLVLDGTTTLGALLVVLSYLGSLFGPVEGTAHLTRSLATARAGALRVLSLHSDTDSVPEPHHPVAPPRPSRGARITFDHVTHGYRPDQPVLQDVTLDIQPGDTIAVLGRTGAGKSTLSALVPRFFDPWEGSVAVEGIDVRRYQTQDLRRLVSVVRQDPLLLPLPIRENIAYGAPWATRSQIERAAETALAAEFIADLPEGYDTVLGERGVTLSGGQRQRLAIARALCRDAPILILDEPTAALDAESEARLMELVVGASEGRTILMIAHRLSTVRWADRIVVMEGGRIVEQGDHESLLLDDGVYARYLQIQSGASDAETSAFGPAPPEAVS
jgi:ATP-binding cassette subfamily B protein